MVAVLPGDASLLCVRPGDRERALESLEASRQPDGSFITKIGGERHQFAVVETAEPYFCSSQFRNKSPHSSPIADLIAFMPLGKNELCVHPDYVEQVIEQLGAVAAEGGGYKVVPRSPATSDEDRPPGVEDSEVFHLKKTLAPVLCAMSSDDEDEIPPFPDGGVRSGDDDPPGGNDLDVDTDNDVDVDTDNDVDVDTDTDPDTGCDPPDTDCDLAKTGCEIPCMCGMGCCSKCEKFREAWGSVYYDGKYAIYKDSSCMTKNPAGSACVDRRFFWPPHHGSRPGSVQNRWEKHRRCSKGYGFCVEVRSVRNHADYFDKGGCPGTPVHSDDYMMMGCGVYPNHLPGTAPPGDPVTKTDTYRLYRNATCAWVSKPEAKPCRRADDMTSGKWERTVYKEKMECRRGAGYCVEANLEIGTRTYYDRQNPDGGCASPQADESITSDNACLP